MSSTWTRLKTWPSLTTRFAVPGVLAACDGQQCGCLDMDAMWLPIRAQSLDQGRPRTLGLIGILRGEKPARPGAAGVLPILLEIGVVEGPLTFKAGQSVTPPDTGAVPMPIPILREVC